MPKKLPKKPKAKVYIDGANMFYTQRDLGWIFDWKKIRKLLVQNYKVLKINFYIGTKNIHEKDKFVRALTHMGFTCHTKALKKIRVAEQVIDHGKYVLAAHDEFKSNFDVEIGIDAVLNSGDEDVVILFSGDSDFVYLVKVLQKRFKKKVHVYSSRKHLSWELRLTTDKYFYLEDFRKEILFRKWPLTKKR